MKKSETNSNPVGKTIAPKPVRRYRKSEEVEKDYRSALKKLRNQIEVLTLELRFMQQKNEILIRKCEKLEALQ